MAFTNPIIVLLLTLTNTNAMINIVYLSRYKSLKKAIIGESTIIEVEIITNDLMS